MATKAEKKKFESLNVNYREARGKMQEYTRNLLTEWVKKCGGEVTFPSMYYNDLCNIMVDGYSEDLKGLKLDGDMLYVTFQPEGSCAWVYVEDDNYIMDVVMNIYFGGAPMMYNENQGEGYQD